MAANLLNEQIKKQQLYPSWILIMRLFYLNQSDKCSLVFSSWRCERIDNKKKWNHWQQRHMYNLLIFLYIYNKIMEISKTFILVWFSDGSPCVKSGFMQFPSYSFLGKVGFRDGH